MALASLRHDPVQRLCAACADDGVRLVLARERVRHRAFALIAKAETCYDECTIAHTLAPYMQSEGRLDEPPPEAHEMYAKFRFSTSSCPLRACPLHPIWLRLSQVRRRRSARRRRVRRTSRHSAGLCRSWATMLGGRAESPIRLR